MSPSFPSSEQSSAHRRLARVCLLLTFPLSTILGATPPQAKAGVVKGLYGRGDELSSDSERTKLAWQAAKNPELSDQAKFRIVLELTLSMTDKGPFIWEQRRSYPNWENTMSLFLSGPGITSQDYPFLKKWSAGRHNEQLRNMLIEMGYLDQSGQNGKKRQFSTADKKRILEFAIKAYEQAL